ncbi:MAG: hypothetical protein CMH78_03905 [Nitrospinae bacterium]|jgi:hypothetical protein|nr:hypothetical protein [Nitrospinota bacterium]HJN01502.1 hypothetical protein [Nitrospinota bacterium]|tara:strand:- start:3191 stop:3391 length:201 start_codon:yes stop_codon:yes gene_type:complete
MSINASTEDFLKQIASLLATEIFKDFDKKRASFRSNNKNITLTKDFLRESQPKEKVQSELLKIKKR